MAKRDSRSLHEGPRRLRTLLILTALGFITVLGRLFALQVIHHEEYAQFARDNQLERERIQGPRGFIRDRYGQVIVDNVLNFQVVMQWKNRDEVQDTVRRLAVFIPIDTTRAMTRFDGWQKRYGHIAFPLFPDADKFVISYVRENWKDYPHLKVEQHLRRRYPHGGVAAHVLGYVGEVTPADMENSSGLYVSGDVVGKAGLERVYEDQLRGIPGQRAVEVTASGQSLGEVSEWSTTPIPGHDLHLDMDFHMQVFLDSLMAVRPNPSAAVVLDVENGGVIAAASHPLYDPNEFALGVSPSMMSELLKDPTKPLFNRISQARYAPASTFKIVVTLAILENQLVDPNRILVYCDGTHRFGNRIFRCWKPEGHGGMDLMSAIISSCDVYFYRVGEMLDVDALASVAEAFGFDKKTGIDLPIEVAGNVPTRRYYDKRHGKGRWTQGLMINNCIGQGEYLATVLHVARVAAAVANGGWLVTPHFVDHIGDDPPVVHERTRVEGLDGDNLAFIRRAMLGVVENPRGTAYWTRLPDIQVAGKTGTAQNPHGDDHSWYMCYAPADNPKIAMAVLVENAGHGSEIAAPIARDFVREYFRPGRLMQGPPVQAQSHPAAKDVAVAGMTLGGEHP
ncbi:MAG TPA: penicillin-binding protein 2 [Candidatus Krumholzibacteria bacterium]|nr:penicillin-binding protein 2 [Candidatus Krumholzibacteria bacterium]